MRFEKVSFDQYREANGGRKDLEQEYADLKLPRRGTKYSAGYDFFAPRDITILPGSTVKIPTGIRVYLDEDKFLLMVPRSSLGFKYRLQLDNTCGVIDSDYVNSDNEGHMYVKLTNDTHEGKTVTLHKGEAIVQGIILQYFKTEDDAVDRTRNGGFGSTNK